MNNRRIILYILIVVAVQIVSQLAADLAAGAIPVAAWLRPYLPSLLSGLVMATMLLRQVVTPPPGFPGSPAPLPPGSVTNAVQVTATRETTTVPDAPAGGGA